MDLGEQQHRRILVVDDATDGREFLAEFLKLQGHSVREAADGLEGLIAASKFVPEIVFLDLCMPRMDGFELCARLRASPLTKDAAVFAVTAGASGRQGADHASARFDAFLQKPVEFEVMDALVHCTCARLRADGP